MKKENFVKISAFSLIELSIVLIIIGFLMASVTGGQSLIASAKLKAFINEVNEYKKAATIFYSTKQRLPDDKENRGKFLINGDNTMFHEPFQEFYKTGILDFDAKECDGEYECNGVNIPKSKVFKRGAFMFVTEYFDEDSNYLAFKFYYSETPEADQVSPKIAERIDQMLDDGIPNDGDVRAYLSDCWDFECDSYNGDVGGVSNIYFKLNI